MPPDGAARLRVDLDDLPKAIDGRLEATVDGIVIRALDGNRPLRLADQLDTTVTPVRAGGDGRAELWIPREGVELTLPRGCLEIEVHVMLFGGPVEALGFDASGKSVARDDADDRKRPAVLRLSATMAMTRVVVSGGTTRGCSIGSAAVRMRWRVPRGAASRSASSSCGTRSRAFATRGLSSAIRWARRR